MFTGNYTTFKEWLAANPQATAYKRRIVRLHELYPAATLSQLRGHAKNGERKLRQTYGSVPCVRGWHHEKH